jgi:UDP-N-acetylmuramoyl-L-alanyl-D-glutamate--2,6-diaminopimelate ligase
MEYTLPSRRHEISAVNGITILDNYCSSPGELDKTLEMMQMLNYDRLKLLISVNKNESWGDGRDTLKIINQWSDMLGISESVLCGCLDIDDKITPMAISDVRKIKKSAGNSLQVKYFDKLQEAIEYLNMNIKAGDMVLLAGGDEMDSAKELLKKHILNSNAAKVLH